MSELLQQGILQIKQRDYQGAIATFDRIIAANSTAPAAYYQRGLAYYQLGQIEKAIADYNQSLDRDTRQINVYLSRASAFIDCDKLQNAIIDLQIVFSLDANCDRAYKLRANICIRLKEYNQAIDYLKQAGKIYLARQDKESCRFCIARIRQIEQQQIAEQGGITNQIFLQQIQQKVNRGNLGEAFRDCNWLLQIDPYDPQAYQCRGEIGIELGEQQQAKQDFDRAAKCFRSQGDLVAAEKLEKRCLELQLENIERQISQQTALRLVRSPYPQNAIQNRLYVLVGNWQIAQSLVERLMLRHPGEAEVWYWEKAIYDIERDRGAS